MIRKIFYYSLVSIISVNSVAQTGSPNLQFIENKGQWDSKVLYKGELNNGAFFLQKQGFTVLLNNQEDLSRILNHHNSPSKNGVSKTAVTAIQKANSNSNPDRLRSHAYAVHFKNSSLEGSVIPDKPLPGYNNYFIGSDKSKWASGCKIYQGITYKDVYPGIDVRYYTSEGRLKYDFIVHPGANPNNIILQYEGADKINVRSNKLQIHTSVGDLEELSPYSYQFDEKGKKEIECRYVLTATNVVRFRLKEYSPQTTLIIDPTLIFSSFSGSSANNWGFTATPGPDGSFYAGGIVFGQGFPVSTGALESIFNGGNFDIGIIKFNSTGSTRVYGTYIGGNGNETPHSLICDPQGNLVVLGRTYSTNFPVLTTFGNPVGGYAHMFVLKLNSTGTNLLGSMLIGGKSNDCVNIDDQFHSRNEQANSLIRNYGDDSRSEVILDGAGNIYVAASTQSTDFPIVGPVFQPNFGGGPQDAVVLKINPDCNSIIFSSFLGGSAAEAGFVLRLNPATNDIYVAGATASSDFPGNKTNVIQSTYQGGICDGFISIISNDGTVLKKSCYFGTPSGESIFGIAFDKNAFPYIMGTTSGSWPVFGNPAFINPGAKQFVCKLQPDLSAYIYSTTFGSAASQPNISPVAFLVDRCENLYISGWGGWIFAGQADPYGLAGTLGMPTTPDAINKSTDNRDFYFIVIKKNASALLYGTFFGQKDGPQSISEHVDGGTSRYDQNGVIYQAICANCGGNSLGPFPTTPGVWARNNGAGSTGCNIAAVKIAFNFAGVGADLHSMINGRYDSMGCIPLVVNFNDTVRNAKSYIWTFGDGSPDSATTAFDVSHTYTAIGTYRVRLIAIDSNSCNIRDTVYMDIRARNDEATLGFTYVKVPPCQSLSFQFTNFSTPPAGKPFTDSSFIWDFGDNSPRTPSGPGSITHSFASAGTYIVKLILADSNYCNFRDSITQTLRVAPLVKAQFVTPSSGCAPYNAIFNNTSVAGQQFIWNFGDGSGSNEFSPSHLYSNVGNYSVSLTVIDSNTCNIIDSTKFSIIVSPKPTAGFSYAPIPPVANIPNIFTNLSTGAVRYKWLFGDGDSVLRNNGDTVLHQYRKTGTFNACLVAYNQYDCTDTACNPVQVLVNPLLDVPNAFTPGRFGQNSIVSVRGFGIASMTFTIYNRWGQKVFESNDPNKGWDGTVNGNPQPMDVYAYTLQATFFDGTKTTKKGDITLIR